MIDLRVGDGCRLEVENARTNAVVYGEYAEVVLTEKREKLAATLKR